MKRAVIGGFLALIGTIWGLTALLFVSASPASSWATPPGRFLTGVVENGMTVPLILAVTLMVAGLAILAVEYFRKEP